MANLDAQPGAQVAAIQTLSGVLTDLVELAGRLPAPASQVEATARILDRLSEELAEAAALLRGRTPSGGWTSGSMTP
jgi:hypothetical protein